MGTVSFHGRFPGMRKPQDFIVYPMQDSGETIAIQSEHRFGRLDLATGRGILSANRQQYANGLWLSLCMARGTAVGFELATEELQTLRQWIKSSGGVEVGGVVKCCNIGALAL